MVAGLVVIHHEDTSRHTGAIEHSAHQRDDALQLIRIHELLADIALFAAAE